MFMYLLKLVTAGAMTLCISLTIGSAQQPQTREGQSGLDGCPRPNSQKRLALVLGNSAYRFASPLRNPVNDASLLAATLKELGFSLIGDKAQVNLGKAATEELIRSFGQCLGAQEKGVGLFFYAGHALQIRGENFLIPVDADIQRETDVKFRAIDINLVLDAMGEAQNGLNLIILDSCRNNPFPSSSRSPQRGLAAMKEKLPNDTLIAYSAAPGEVALDGQGTNSPYTEELAQQMKGPCDGLAQTFERVTRGVSARTSRQQKPWVSYSVERPFCFNPAEPVAARPAPTPKATPVPASKVKTSLVKIVKEAQTKYVSASVGTDESRWFKDIDLERFKKNKILEKITADLRRDKTFVAVVAQMKELSTDEQEEILQAAADTYKRSWAELGINPRDRTQARRMREGQTDAGSEAETLIAQAITDLAREILAA
jgi:hypothetical protein